MAPAFIADVHLGRLARYLRLLGFNTLYNNNYSFDGLLSIARQQKRVLLSRSPAFSDKGVSYLQVTSEDYQEQLKAVIDHFGLRMEFAPFTRCLLCNGKLELVDKEKIIDLIQLQTAQYFTTFWQCQHCKKIYWEGSHYERMKQLIAQLNPNPSSTNASTLSNEH